MGAGMRMDSLGAMETARSSNSSFAPLEDDQPFVLILVVTHSNGRPAARGEDPLDSVAVARLKNCGQLFGQVGGDVSDLQKRCCFISRADHWPILSAD